MGRRTESTTRDNAWLVQNEKTGEYYKGADYEFSDTAEELDKCDGSSVFSHCQTEVKLMTEGQAVSRARTLREILGSRWTAYKADEAILSDSWEP